MANSPSTPKKPVYQLRRITAWQESLLKNWLDAEKGSLLQQKAAGPLWQQLVDRAGCVLSDAKVERLTLERSCQELAGQKLTLHNLTSLSWRLAGNVEKLAAGLAVSSMPAITQWPLWVPSCVVLVQKRILPGRKATERFTARAARRGAQFHFLVLAGVLAGQQLSYFLSESRCAFLRSEMGFPRRRTRPTSWPTTKPFIPYTDPLEYFGFRCLLLLDKPTQEVSSSTLQRQPKLERMSVPVSMRTHNQDLIYSRARLPTATSFRCPLKLASSSHPCHRCPAGTSRCRLACHPQDWQVRACEVCRQDTYWSIDDAASPKGICLRCLATRGMNFSS